MKTELIHAQNLSKNFGNIKALQNVNFVIKKGDSVALVGPNGAGKSTLMSIMCGFLRPTSGKLTLNGIAHDSDKTLGLIGALPQDAQLNPSESIGEQLAFLAELQGFKPSDAKRESKRVLNSVRLESNYNSRPKSLSHGMAKRVSIAQALIGSPPIIILDEPTAGLDPETARHLRNLLKTLNQTTTLLVSSHNLEELENLCHRTLFLEQGQLSEIEHDAMGSVAYLTVELAHVELQMFKQLIQSLEGIKSVQSKGIDTLIIGYDTQSVGELDIILIKLLKKHGWSYRSILRGKKLEDQLFSGG
jgi:ABC-2 type transport system ATP-binding protein